MVICRDAMYWELVYIDPNQTFFIMKHLKYNTQSGAVLGALQYISLHQSFANQTIFETLNFLYSVVHIYVMYSGAI